MKVKAKEKLKVRSLEFGMMYLWMVLPRWIGCRRYLGRKKNKSSFLDMCKKLSREVRLAGEFMTKLIMMQLRE